MGTATRRALWRRASVPTPVLEDAVLRRGGRAVCSEGKMRLMGGPQGQGEGPGPRPGRRGLVGGRSLDSVEGSKCGSDTLPEIRGCAYSAGLCSISKGREGHTLPDEES